MDDLIPWSSQSEMAVLGALLIENKRWDTVAHILKPEHFYDFVNGKIFTAIAVLMAQNKLDNTRILFVYHNHICHVCTLQFF
jgi:replicative DNA helicase